MSTIHNQVYTQILTSLVSSNFEALAATGSIVDNGENVPFDEVFEPWMRTEVSCWEKEVEGKRVAYIMFRAGPFRTPFQELVASVCEDDLTKVTVEHTVPSDEYPMCEMVTHMTHLVIAQLASLAQLPGCCCLDTADGAVHVHPEFVVPDIVEVPTPEQLNSLVLGHYNKKDEGIGRGLINPFGQQIYLTHPDDPATPSTNVHAFKPRTPKE